MSASRFENGFGCGRAMADDAPAHALPGDPKQWPRDRSVRIENLVLDVALDVEAKCISGTATYTVTPFNDGLREVAFDAFEMEIQRVMVDGRRVRHAYDSQSVTVPAGRARKRGHTFEIAITYRCTPRMGLFFIAPDEAYPDKPRQAWTQGQDEDSKYWFPCIDAPNSKQPTEMIARVPESWFALSNGELLSDTDHGDGTRTFHWRQERPHSTYLVTLAAGEFSRIDSSTNGLTIDYYVEERDLDRGRRTFKNTPAMIALFERVTGMPFPWAKYSQIVVRDFIFGGMENTSATSMTELILLDGKAARDLDSDGLISHELAHMWFGDLLTCRDWSHGWLNEGFASYSELLWREHHKGVDEYRQGIVDETAAYLGESYRRPIVSNVYNEPIDVFDRHLYEKGALVLHMLRGVLGDDQFFRSIQRYVRDNQDTNVVTQDLIDAVAAETGRNLDWFFDQWVFSPGHPKIEVSWSWDGDHSLATVSVKQTQSGKDIPEVFRAPLDIDFIAADAAPVSFRVEVTEREQRFVFPLPTKPDLCRFDPHNRVLKELEFKKPLAELTRQLVNDDDVAGRARAAADLGKMGGPDAVAALSRAIAADRFWGVKAAAARALGEVRTTGARDALLAHLGIGDHKARRAVVAALGAFRGDEAVLEALRPLARKDDSYFVEAEANRSTGKLRLPAGFDDLVANINRPSHRESVRAACIDGLVELRDERGLDVIAESARYGAPATTRAVAVGALARLGDFFEGRKKRLGDDIAAYLDDQDFRVRLAAMNAIRTLKDERFIARLEAQSRRELDGRGVRTARQVVAALRKGATTSEDVRKLRDDLDRLRADNTKLRERLEKLEARETKTSDA